MSDSREPILFEELADALTPSEREELAGRLAASSEPLDPSPALRERVMARIARSEALHSERSARRWRAAAALAAAAAFGAILTWTGVTESEPQPGSEVVAEAGSAAPDEQLAELEELLEEQDQELAALEQELEHTRDALSVLTARRLERLDLVSAESSDSSARVYWDWDEYSCYFVAEGLPESGGESRYALWLYTDADEVLLAGRFAAADGAPASFFAMLPKEMGKVVRAVVTEEPDAGAQAPSGRVLLAGGAVQTGI